MTASQTSADAPIIHLPITGKRGGRYGIVVGHARVIDDDFTRTELLPLRWHLTSGYACRKVYLHRVVFEHYHGAIPAGLEVDHIDRDRLNNVPTNLRAVAHSTNSANGPKRRNNTTGFAGVTRRMSKTGWRYLAQIMVRGVLVRLGLHATPHEAARAVNDAYRLHFPEVAVPNPEAA